MKRKSQRLINKTRKIQSQLSEIYNSLQFQAQHHEIRQMLYSSMDKLKEFADNIDNGDNF